MKITSRTAGPSTDSQIRQIFEMAEIQTYTSTGSLIASIEFSLDQPGDRERYAEFTKCVKEILDRPPSAV